MRTWLAPIGAALALAACGDGTGPGSDDAVPAALAGTWVADQSCLPLGCGIVLAPAGNEADSINVTHFLGLSTEITITRAGVFRLVTRPGSDGPSTASARADAHMIIVTDPAGTVDTLDYTVTSSTLRLRWRRTFENELMGPVRMRGTLHKR
jgi:hypothetical protein